MNRLNPGDTIGILACSNPLEESKRSRIGKLVDLLHESGFFTILSPLIYESEVPPISGKERAAVLLDFYKNPEIKAIFDISGGDMANEVLPYLDFDVIKENDKTFFGYSDLTVIINAIYAKTGRSSVLYQPSHLVWQKPITDFVEHMYDVTWQHPEDYMYHVTRQQAEDYMYHVTRQQVEDHPFISGCVVGGNIRCFLKLAGTDFWPDLAGKVLLLESLGGRVPQMLTYLSQLKLLGAFEKINGILLGTFTEMEANDCQPEMYQLVRSFAGPDMPIACTRQIGHAKDARAIHIGDYIVLRY